MKLIPLGRSQSVWKPFCRVWRLSQLPEPAASVTAGAESCDRKQPKPQPDKDTRVPVLPSYITLIFPSCENKCLTQREQVFSNQTGLGSRKQKWVSLRYKLCRNCGRNARRCCYIKVIHSISSLVDLPQHSLQLPTIMNDPFRTPGCLKAQAVTSQSHGEAGYHENQALGWRLNSVVRSDPEHRPVCSLFTQTHTLELNLCPSGGERNRKQL